MKLTDLKRHQAALRRRPPKTTEVFKDCDLWMARGGASDLGEADVEVEFDYTPASFSDHPYGSGTAREHHPSSLDIQSVTLVKDANRYDDEGNVIGKLEKGTDLMKQSWWQESWTEWFADQIQDRMEADAEVRDDDRFDFDR